MSDVSIIQQFLHPPVGLLVKEVIPGNPHSGLNGLQRIRGLTNVDAFGIAWLVTFAPAGYGVSPRAGTNVYDRPVIDIAVQHRFLDGSLNITFQQSYDLVAGHILFEESFPYIVDVELGPGVQADLHWLLAL